MKGWEDVTEEGLSKLGIKYIVKTNKKPIAKKKIDTDINIDLKTNITLLKRK